MPRADISNQLIHFTKGETWDAAFDNLRSILQDRAIVGGVGHIRGGFRCVCFTEAPFPILRAGLVNLAGFSRYSPFGVVLDKAEVFARGGRPAIYQSDEEFGETPPAMQWRHVRYEPAISPAIDFTWEREWRILTDRFEINPTVAGIIVPGPEWADRLEEEHLTEQELYRYHYTELLGQDLAQMLQEPFPWRVYSTE